MRTISKSVKLIISIVLAIQIISFAGFAVTSTVHQKEATEFVEKARLEAAGKVKFNNIFDTDGQKNNSWSILIYKPSYLLALFNKTCFIKHKQQNFKFYNTVKSSLLATLLPYLHNNLPEASL